MLESLLEQLKALYPAERIQDGRDMNFIALLHRDSKTKLKIEYKGSFELNEFFAGFQTGPKRHWSKTAQTVAEALSLIKEWDSQP